MSLLALLIAQALPLAPKSPGEQAFLKCYSCHSAQPGEHGLQGPNLADVLGRKAGSLPEFEYSPAFARADFIWDRDRLDRFLQNPDSVVPGTVMAVPRLSEGERAAILDCLSRENRPEITP
jgi:cytochrome c